MPGLTFEREVTRDAVWLRALFMGPTGAGKSKGALEVASRLAVRFETPPPTLINTEKGRGKLYADRYELGGYITLEDNESQGPDTMVEAIYLAEQENPGAPIVLDSASHEWMGRDGVLQRADRFGDWKTVRPQHQKFVDRLKDIEAHVIVCVRSKMEYAVTEEEKDGRKRQTITALGLGPVQDKDFQYEFNLVGQFDLATHMVSFSGHVDPLVDRAINLMDEAETVETVELLATWLSEGNPIVPPPRADESDVAALRASLDAEGITPDVVEEKFAIARRQNRGQLHPDYVAEQLANSRARIEKKAAKRQDVVPPAEDAAAATT